MEFWGVEVKAGQSLAVKPESHNYLHLSQATLGEIKKDKGTESVTVFLKLGDQKLVLGILSPEKFPHLSFDLVFEKEFELSHNWKNGSVYFCGYQSSGEDQEDDKHLDSDSGSEEEELPLHPSENGKPGHKEEEKKPTTDKLDAVKPESSKKPNVKLPEPSKEEDDESEDDDESDEDESDEDMLGADSSDTDDDDGTESDEETPKKVESAKKRLNESASKTPVPAKKAKSALPEKTDGKKGGHTATPHPGKKPVKTPAHTGQSKTETPKSGGQFSCKSCDRSFGSDNALQSHNKAKHGGK